MTQDQATEVRRALDAIWHDPVGPSSEPLSPAAQAVVTELLHAAHARTEAAGIEALEEHNPIRGTGPLAD